MREQQARAHARQKLLPVWLGGSGTKVDGMHESRWHARKQMACAFSEASGQMPNFGLSLSLHILFVPYISTRLDNARRCYDVCHERNQTCMPLQPMHPPALKDMPIAIKYVRHQQHFRIINACIAQILQLLV